MLVRCTLVLFISLVLSSGLQVSDQVYLKIEKKYYSGHSLEKVLAKLKYFNCLFPDSKINKVLLSFHRKSEQRETKLSEVLNLKIERGFEKNPVASYLVTLLKFSYFLEGYDVTLSPMETKQMIDQVSLSGCQFPSILGKKNRAVMKDFYSMESFILSRFNLNQKELSRQNLQAVFTFFDSISKQYKDEYFK